MNQSHAANVDCPNNHRNLDAESRSVLSIPTFLEWQITPFPQSPGGLVLTTAERKKENPGNELIKNNLVMSRVKKKINCHVWARERVGIK